MAVPQSSAVLSLAGLARCTLLLELLRPERTAILDWLSSPELDATLASDRALRDWLEAVIHRDDALIRDVRMALLDARQAMLSLSVAALQPAQDQ